MYKLISESDFDIVIAQSDNLKEIEQICSTKNPTTLGCKIDDQDFIIVREL